MSLFDLTGKVAIVTGSSRGMGRAIASKASSFTTGHTIICDGGVLV